MGGIRPNFRMTLLISSLIFTYTTPVSKIILPEDFAFKQTYVVLLLASSVLSMIYLALSIAYRGRVKSDPEAVGLLDRCPPKAFCRKCNSFKPERAHHCSTCGHCVRKMDHHCFWINNCVNYDNQGHFIRFLLFTSIANMLILAHGSAQFVAILFMGHSLKNEGDYYVLVLSWISSLVLLVMAGFFLYLQLRLAMMNMTFIEELKQEDVNRFQGFVLLKSPYDRGLMNNLVDSLGPAYTLFLVGPFGDGITFAKACPAEYWSSSNDYRCIEDLIDI